MSADCQLRVPGKDPELPPIDTAATWNGGFFCCAFGVDAVHRIQNPVKPMPVSRETGQFPGDNDVPCTVPTPRRCARFT